MRLKNPMVSIIIPVYNGDNYVRKAIDSALAQDYDNTEVIVVNDGSNDDGKTEEAVKEYGDKVNYYCKENGGVSSALNYGISKMNGDYFSWLSHDDEYTSDKISLQIEQLRRFDFDEHIIALCGNRQIDKDSHPLEKESIQTAFEADCMVDSKIVLKRLIDLGSFYGCSLLIPRSCFKKCGKFDENLRYSQDMLMWLNIFLEDYKLIYSGKQCVLNRVHNNQLTQTGRSLFHHDCEVIGHKVIPKLVSFDPSGELVYRYALSCAKYENNNVVKECMLFSKGLLTDGQKLRIRIQEAYGHIRPILRKVYYRICKRVKTHEGGLIVGVYGIFHNSIKNKATRRKLLCMLGFLPDEVYLKIAYRFRTGKKLDLKDPHTFTEKLQWLKIYNHDPSYSIMVDKYEAKNYIEKKVGPGYTIPTIGVWDSFEDIDFSSLPDQFVLKCTHDSGTYVICRDKNTLDIEAASKRISSALACNYYKFSREWPYKNVKPRLIAEKYMQETQNDATHTTENVLTDYKFFCFNGVPRIMYVSKDTSNNPRTDFFDMTYHHLPIKMKDPNSRPDELPECPAKFDEMKRIAQILSAGIPHLRVDFYIIDGRLYVGELTFFHMSGFARIHPEEWEYKLGEWIELPEKNR